MTKKKNTFKVTASEPAFGFYVGEIELVNVHEPNQCSGEFCVIHRPSNHHMNGWPLHWRGDIRVMERTCPHGVGHPDPDDLAFHARNEETWQAVHGCDGCCAE